MARSRRKLDRRAEAAQLLQRLKGEPAGWRRERLLALKLGLEGQLTLQEIAANLGRARSCIQRWLEGFRRGGLEGLLHRPQGGKGPASHLSPDLAHALGQKLAAGEFRRAADPQRWLAQERDPPVKLAPPYKNLKKARRRVEGPPPC